jgi:septal ring factor EnvC (AmiA/AmiB activator)
MPGVIAVFVLGALVGLLIAWYPSRQQAHVHLRECDSLRDALNDHRRRLEQQAAEKDELQTQLLTQEQKIRDLTAQSEWRRVTIDQ